MARYVRLDVINTLLGIGIVPLFYCGEVETAIELINACTRGGARVIEFTNRGEQAYPVFIELVKYFVKADPSVILGIGSIIDAPTAALYLAAGANFIVGPSFNPEISRLCNRRKVLYIPGCATETEISTAEEFGAEICKVFPGETVGGANFIKSVIAPCPWHKLMPTGGVDANEASISAWFKAGAVAIGMGSKLISSAAIKEKNYDGVSIVTAQCVAWIQKTRGDSVFTGIEHIGLYSRSCSPEALSSWYEKIFGMKRNEGNTAYFISGSGPGRIEFPKPKADVPVHIAVKVSNFEVATDVLRSQGIGLRDIVIKPTSKSGYLDVTDPDGNLVHILWLPV
jgi:2-dehydro-3-deoxyphosphogluconate aldolase / (4S)-4-hydroxy-2-oxoglutarate aldolase